MKIKVMIFLMRIAKTALILSLMALLLDGSQAQDVRKEEIQRQMESLTSLLQPSAKQKVIQAARALEDKIFSSSGKVDFYAVSVSSIKSQFRGLSSQDIDALVSLVMFELWKSEEEDLKEIIDEMHKMNQLKEKQRDYIDRLKKQKASMKEKLKESYGKAAATGSSQKRAAASKISPETARTRRLNIKYIKTPALLAFKDPQKMSAAELEGEIRNAEAYINSMTDMSQMMQLDLQNELQKEQQFIQTISNIMKAMHDTLKDIIQNLK